MIGPRILDVRWEDAWGEVVGDVARHLEAGGLVTMPTETVYGFGCVPDEEPLMELQRLKARGPEKPFLLLIPSADAVPQLTWGPEARELAEVFWPGALTLVLRDPTGSFPPGIRGPQGGVAVRVSPHPVARDLMDALGGPIVSTSANAPGGAPALTALEAWRAARGFEPPERMWILDSGPLQPSEPSTIVDCSGPVPTIRRRGALPVNRISCVLPEIHDPS